VCGGQHINKTDSAVRITTFQPASSPNAEGRSQHGNKAQAMKVLTARIHENRSPAKDAAERRLDCAATAATASAPTTFRRGRPTTVST
jgi:protein subunit release factor A